VGRGKGEGRGKKGERKGREGVKRAPALVNRL